MPLPFDATTKHLLELQPADWLEYVGLPRLDAEVIPADLSTVTADADIVLRVKGPSPFLLHLEFQTAYDTTLPARTLLYSVLLTHRHSLPVVSVVILLHRRADGKEMTGALHYASEQGTYLHFHYQIVRVWEKPVEESLTGGLATLPLAPLSDVTRRQLPQVIERMKQRITQETTEQEGGQLWTATFVLLGLRYPDSFIQQLLQGVRNMKESTTYQLILREGRAEGRVEGRAEGLEMGRNEGKAEEARQLLLRLGRKRFGPPPQHIEADLQNITSLERLEQLAERLLEVENWQELIQ